ncbi:uncharacterized protein BO95DRAFT_479649 [Aspergillus brunneoviolaceus CBS 621.78]|uniref:Uncharacterized protein n=1 Tax=Aspergillus brunneoviolaceus CBS 621.78 TaxID=1450534 RepID=A0ACD1GIL0_9EURO|nr:hypothetical protein BO95DRAFT_479649 [Aspergillus brunneoviolaceus CBS 621.78]RAH49000.1 hypothetical protein BO95DRAFT_479649 [Aspergillus brunneoviolaceus CBS 621.78]
MDRIEEFPEVGIDLDWGCGGWAEEERSGGTWLLVEALTTANPLNQTEQLFVSSIWTRKAKFLHIQYYELYIPEPSKLLIVVGYFDNSTSPQPTSLEKGSGFRGLHGPWASLCFSDGNPTSDAGYLHLDHAQCMLNSVLRSTGMDMSLVPMLMVIASLASVMTKNDRLA